MARKQVSAAAEPATRAGAVDTAQNEGVKRAPCAKPNFTLKDVRDAIPKHCFERNTLTSLRHLALDVLACSILFYLSSWIDHPAIPKAVAYGLLWPAYWYLQGAFATGIWVLSHECGHGAFSDLWWVNDLVGFIFHSALLVPYYSWKHSHRRHHQNTGSVVKDEVFVPKVKEPGAVADLMSANGFVRLGHIVFMLTLGWPTYLVINVGGRHYDRWANHFDPYSPIFTKKERGEIVLSDLGLAAAFSVLGWLYNQYGFVWLLKTYIVPYLIVNHWLVLITFLQHTHPKLPHYDENEWEWLRGALSTMDRVYSFGLDHIFHRITDTHVVHHLFSYMPFYHAAEATEAVKKVLGDYYQKDERFIYKALWEDFRDTSFVTEDKPGTGVFWFHKGF